MALRLRRGIDAERQLITPLEGELIYTTDTKILYIGDGLTAGGIPVTGAFPQSIDDLNDIDISTNTPLVGQTLVWNGVNFVPETITNNLSIYDLDEVFAFEKPNPSDILIFDGLHFVPGQISRIEGADSTIILDANTNTFTGNFIGDGSGLTNLPTLDIIQGGTYQFNITGEDSSVIVDSATNTFTGNFVGDGSGLTSLPTGVLSLDSLSNVFQFSDPDKDDVLMFDGFNWTPQRIRRLVSDDSTLAYRASTGTFTGNFVGDLLGNVSGNTTGIHTGDVFGSLYNDDSSIIIDASTNTINGNFVGDINSSIITYQNNLLTINSETNGRSDIHLVSTENNTVLKFVKNSNSDLSLDTNNPYGGIYFERNDVNGPTTTSYILGGTDFLALANDPSGTFTNTNLFVTLKNGNLGIGNVNPQSKVDVTGDIKATGFIQFGSLTTSERNNLTPVNGMIIYNTTDNKFQGYQNGAWINIDNGSVA